MGTNETTKKEEVIFRTEKTPDQGNIRQTEEVEPMLPALMKHACDVAKRADLAFQMPTLIRLRNLPSFTETRFGMCLLLLLMAGKQHWIDH